MRHLACARIALSVVISQVALNGCGDGGGVAQQSPEAKKADLGGQKAMEDYMQSKGQAKTQP